MWGAAACGAAAAAAAAAAVSSLGASRLSGFSAHGTLFRRMTLNSKYFSTTDLSILVPLIIVTCFGASP